MQRMQDQSVEATASISQLLRETYSAERGMQKAETARHESDSMHHPSSVNSPEVVKRPDDVSDLSAFLTQEELDKSVSLAIQEIHQTPYDIKQLEPQKSTIYSADEINNTLKIASNEKKLQLVSPSTDSEKDNHPDNRKCFQDSVVTVPKVSIESSHEPYQERGRSEHGAGKESKKELKNKAADFIEELSALFKTHNSKKIRPKTCKKHGSKHKTKGGIAQEWRTDYTNMSETRERHHTSIPINVEEIVDAPSVLLINKEEEDKDLENETELKTTEASSENSQTPLHFEATMSQPPTFIQKLKSREILEGAKVQLDCTVMGFPAPNVRWYCEGKELENSPDIQILQDGNVHSLVISEAFQEDTGRYSCFASNIHGTDSTSAEIYIEGASSESESDRSNEEMDEDQRSVSEPDASTPPRSSPVIHQEVHKELQVTQGAVSHDHQRNPEFTKYLQGLDGKPLIAAPVFTKTIQDLLASEGQLIVFECRVKGAPSPKVEWYREGSLIEDSPEFRILQKKPRSIDEPEEICTLVIAEVFSEDSGHFSCTASNKYGTVSSSAHLKVKGSEDYRREAVANVSEINVPAFKHQQLQSQPGPVSSIPAYSLREPPSKLKLEGVLVNHNEPRSSSKLGLRVHFKLPDDDIGTEGSSEEGTLTSNEIYPNSAQEINKKPSTMLGASSHFKEPPPLPSKPKLGPVQLQLLHNQVLLEQQQLQPSIKPTFQVDMSSFNSFSPPTKHQHAALANQQRKGTYPEPFTCTRPKEFDASQPTTTFSPLNYAVGMSSLIHSGKPPSPSAFAESVVQSPPKQLCSQNSFADHKNVETLIFPTVRIQNPAAFLRTVLPSLPSIPPLTNNMGLPRSAPTMSSKGIPKRTPMLQQLDLVHKKNVVVEDIKRKLYFKDDILKQHQQEYKISSFEQRLMNEIEFRLERSPVDESDEEVQHDEIPSGKCIAPIFDKRLKHFRALEGTSVVFTCKVVGIPIPKVYWFKDGTQISKKNARYKMKRGTDGTCSLHIEIATNDDDGNYTIMAANPQGKISCSGHLLVRTPSLHDRRTSTVHLHRARLRLLEGDGEPMQDSFFRPYFLQAPGDMVAHEGRVCRLDCKVSGLPTPELSWLLDGKPVTADATHRLLITENGIHSLIIDPVTRNDAGTYTCIATNKAGQNAFNLDLNVVAKEVKQIPMFLEKLLNSGVPEGHPVRLEGRVVGMPPPVFYWKKDNETIAFNDPRISMHQDMTGYVCLLIQPTKKDDAGWYTLSAKNEAGIVSCTARLDIYAQWHQQIPQSIKKGRPSGSRNKTFTGQELDMLSAFPSFENHIINASSSKDVVESEEL
ncbi:myopalladin [Lissotriton helveticus]